MGRRFIDWDAARAERRAEPVVVRLFGQDWDLPSDMPAEVMLEIVRLEASEGPDAEVEEARVFAALSRIVPAETLQAWFERGLGASDLPGLLVAILRLYQQPWGLEDDDGERAEGEVRTPSSSSSAGRR